MSGLKILLYRPPARHHVTVFPQKTFPLGLLSIAGMLRHHGFTQVRLVDGFEGSNGEDLAREAGDWQPDVVGISGLTAHAYDGMAAAHMVKEAAPGALIIAGGIHFSAVPDETLRVCPYIDLVAVGEGEMTFLELCQALPSSPALHDWRTSLSSVAGLCWLAGGAEPALDDKGHTNPDRPLVYTEKRKLMSDLSQLTMPAFDLTNPDRYRMHPYSWSDYVMLEGSRGCPFQCTYCHTTQFWQKRWRPRPVEAILDEVEYSVRQMGRRAIHFTDDSWATRRDRVIEFCEGILSRGLDVDIWAQCRVDDLYRDRDLFGLMKRAGFYGFLIGFESGEQQALDRWKKGVEVDKARAIAPLLTEHFDSIIGTFFIGDWETTAESFEATRLFSREIGVDIFIEAPLTLFPPTIPIWKEYENRGLKMEWDYDQIGNCKVILPTGTLDRDAVLGLQKRNMAGFYTDPKKAWHALSSGPHSARQFSTMIFSGLEDAVRERARSTVPAHWRGRSVVLRREYRDRHLEFAASRPMPIYDSKAWSGPDHSAV
jgi:anaerobic magnesium-protoporphyrin IX monomethyl ester cyclase